MSSVNSDNSEWKSRWVFFFAAMAGAIGLGNIWKFPFIMAENGGIAFIGIYFVCVLLFGVPLMLSEVVIGHIGNANPVTAMKSTAIRSKASKHWSVVGYLSLLAGLGVFILLTVVAGWAISYLIEMYQNIFVDIGRSQAIEVFSAVKSNHQGLLLSQTLFIALIVFTLGFGVHKGLARGLNYLIPLSIVVLLVLISQTINSDYFYPSLDYLFKYEKEEISFNSFLLAIKHAFYTLSIGVGSLMVFGSYVPKRRGIGVIVMSVALFDIIISSLIGLVVMPVLLFSQIDSATGYDLLFVTLPVVFGEMANGQFFGVVFFLFVLLTALSSAMVLLEPSVAWLQQRFSLHRWQAVILAGFITWVVALLCMGGNSVVAQTGNTNYEWFTWINIVTANVLIPTAGFLIVVYVGWFLKPDLVKSEMENSGAIWLFIWYFLIRTFVPLIFLLVVMLNLLDI
jgi:NSS family neurotransmitter:Na+ symporter